MVKDSFAAGEVVRIVGISYRQLDHWDRSGFIKPSLGGASGKGSERQYNFLDLVQLRVAKMLRDSGVSLGRIKKSLDYLRRAVPAMDRPLAEMVFLTDGKDIFVLTDDPDVIVNTSRSGQMMFNLNIGVVSKDLETRTYTKEWINDGQQKMA